MPSIGPLEILVVGVIALIVFGPERLPTIARTFGRALNEFRRQAGDIRAEFESSFEDDEDEEDLGRDNKPVIHAPEPKQLPTAEGIEPAGDPEPPGRPSPSG